MDIQTSVGVLLALQFAAFGWRIIREIDVGDQERRTWIPIPDYFNIVAMFAVIVVAVILPFAGADNVRMTRTTLSAAFVLIAMHPINTAAHYRLFSTKGRAKYTNQKKDYPWVTDQETATLIITVILVAISSVYVYSSNP